MRRCSAGGTPSPSSRTEKRALRPTVESVTVTRPPSGEYFTAFSTRFVSTWRTLSPSAATSGTPCFGVFSSSSMPGGMYWRAASTTLRASSTGSRGPIARRGPPDLSLLTPREAVGLGLPPQEGVVDDGGEPVGLACDHLEEAGALRLGDDDVLSAQRQRGARNRSERRPELVRDRGHEVGLERLDRTLFGQVAERVDAAAVERNAGDREPEGAVVHFHRQRVRAQLIALRQAFDRRPLREDLGGEAPERF